MNESNPMSGVREKRYYTSLARNMLLSIMLVSFTPLVLIAGVIGYYFETSYRQKVIENLSRTG